VGWQEFSQESSAKSLRDQVVAVGVAGAVPPDFPRRIIIAAAAAMMIITITIAPAISSVLEEDELDELDVLEEFAGALDVTTLVLLTDVVLGVIEVEVVLDAIDVTEVRFVTEEVVEVEVVGGNVVVEDAVVEPTMETLSRDCIFKEPK